MNEKRNIERQRFHVGDVVRFDTFTFSGEGQILAVHTDPVEVEGFDYALLYTVGISRLNIPDMAMLDGEVYYDDLAHATCIMALQAELELADIGLGGRVVMCLNDRMSVGTIKRASYDTDTYETIYGVDEDVTGAAWIIHAGDVVMVL